MTTFLPLNASCVWTLVGAPQAVPVGELGCPGVTYMKVALGIRSPLEIAWCAKPWRMNVTASARIATPVEREQWRIEQPSRMLKKKERRRKRGRW